MTEKALELHNILYYPLVTEKAVNMIDKENKIVFIINKEATKPQVKEAIQTLYEVKVDKVDTLLDRKGRKKAFVKISKESSAADLATKLGVI